VVAVGVDRQSGVGDAVREFFHLGDRCMLVVCAVDDQHRAADLGQPIGIQIPVALI
jgi:hypothetical protein